MNVATNGNAGTISFFFESKFGNSILRFGSPLTIQALTVPKI
jgi:hypothetical protein